LFKDKSHVQSVQLNELKFEDKAFSEAAGMTNVRELKWTATYYFDYQAASNSASYHPIGVSLNQDAFGTGSREGNIITKVTIHALPVSSNAQNFASSYLFQGATLSDSNSGTGDNKLRLLNVTNKLVHPTFNVTWAKLYQCDFLKVFRDSNVRPYVNSTAVQEVARIRLVDPDSGLTFTTTPIQMKVDVEFTSNLPIENVFGITSKTQYASGWTDPINSSAITLTYAQVTLRSLQQKR